MMANSSRDPYWQASVRRETLDHPSKKAEIEDECSTCHMPMARTMARAAGGLGQVFAHLPVGRDGSDAGRARCRRRVLHALPSDQRRAARHARELHRRLRRQRGARTRARPIFGPFRIDAGRTRIMHSAAGVTPTEATHIQQSELCATCHTLYTRALGPNGEVHGVAPRAGAVPRVAAQRLSSRAKLPVVSHAGGCRPDADLLGARRAAGRAEPPCVHRRKLLHAADVEPLPRRSSASTPCRSSSNRPRGRRRSSCRPGRPRSRWPGARVAGGSLDLDVGVSAT